METILTLVSGDGHKVQIDAKAAEKSKLLSGLIADYDNSDIPLPEVKQDILNKVIQYLTYYKDKVPKEIPKPLPTATLGDCLDQWDLDFINSFQLNDVFDLINAANYMDIPSLLDLACCKIASVMKGKTAEEIRAMFSIECDLSEEEIKEYEEFQI